MSEGVAVRKGPEVLAGFTNITSQRDSVKGLMIGVRPVEGSLEIVEWVRLTGALDGWLIEHENLRSLFTFLPDDDVSRLEERVDRTFGLGGNVGLQLRVLKFASDAHAKHEITLNVRHSTTRFIPQVQDRSWTTLNGEVLTLESASYWEHALTIGGGFQYDLLVVGIEAGIPLNRDHNRPVTFGPRLLASVALGWL